MKVVPSILFVSKILFTVPIKAAIELWNISSLLTWSFIWKKKIWLRLLMREATSICDRDTIEHVLNPLFEWINRLFMQPSRLSVLNQTIHYSWYYKPLDYDPRMDGTLIFVHGGGYALKLVPFGIIFLNHLTQLFPRMAIIVHDYSVSIDSKRGQLPQQSHELKQLYKYLREDIGCKDITLLGESAGGHIVLYLLLLLQIERLSLPEKVLAISPWCNPLEQTVRGSESVHYGVFDSLKSDHLDVFGIFLQSSKELKNIIPLNLETDFQEITWKNILDKTRVYISYGTHEILCEQIAGFSNRLQNASNNSANITFFEDLHGAHIQPLLHLTKRNHDEWSQLSNVAPLVSFLQH